MTFADLLPADRAEARRILDMPQGTEAERRASVREWIAFIDQHRIDGVALFTDDFGSRFFRDNHGTVTPVLQEMVI
jgi:hypothetical protein